MHSEFWSNSSQNLVYNYK